MKVMPSLASCSAKIAFSLRKPYLNAGHEYSMDDRKSMNSTQDVQPAAEMRICTMLDGVYAPVHQSYGTPR
jgi:hypothetical protein